MKKTFVEVAGAGKYGRSVSIVDDVAFLADSLIEQRIVPAPPYRPQWRLRLLRWLGDLLVRAGQ